MARGLLKIWLQLGAGGRTRFKRLKYNNGVQWQEVWDIWLEGKSGIQQQEY